MYTCMCHWVTMLYSRKLTEHCKPAIMEKIKIIIKKKENVNVELHLITSRAGAFPRLRLGHELGGQACGTGQLLKQFSILPLLMLQEQVSVHVLLRSEVRASHSPSGSPTGPPTSQGGLVFPV